MTTIAYKKGFLVCDGLILQGDTIISSNINKIHKRIYDAGKYNKCLIGVAGNVGDLSNVQIASISCPEDLKDLNLSSSTTLLVIFSYDRYIEVYIVTGDNKVTHIYSGSTNDENFCVAIGSGKEAALGAMYAGANAYEAVEIASKVDIATGGLIREARID